MTKRTRFVAGFRCPGRARILASVRNRMLAALAAVLVVAAICYMQLDVILATFVVIVVATVALVLVLSSDWSEHSTYEQRELARARKRAEKWDRNAGARAKDRALWEAYQAKKAAGDPD